MPFSRLRRIVFLGALFFTSSAAHAITIDLDFDTSSYFYGNTTARTTIQQAAADVSAAITSSLDEIDQNVWERSIDISSTPTPTSGTYTWNFSYTIPGQAPVSITPNLPSNTVKIFVRQENISGSTLGKGGSAGIGFSAGYSAFPSDPNLQSEFGQLVDLQSMLAQDEFTRGAGPVISTIAGTSTLDFGGPPPEASWNYSVSYGPAYGTLAFDVDEDNNGVGDTPASLEEYWHLNYATPVAAGKNDLYSVAIHEILHALGVGSSETWNNLSSGTTWTGAQAIAERGTGSGSGLVNDSHVTAGTLSKRITDGQTQEVVMDPDITVGNRKFLTTLDLAFLRDLGYSTIMPNFGIEGDFNGDGTVDERDYTIWRDNLGAANELALGGNGNGLNGVDIADYTLWKNNFGTSIPGALASAAVPEPGTLSLLFAGFLALSARIFLAKSSAVV